MKSRVIINGKFADNRELREVLKSFKSSFEFDVRLSWEAGDLSTFAEEMEAGYDRVIVVGGDGSVNETVCGLMKLPNPPELAVVPLGTANDLATGAKIPVILKDAFEFAFTGSAVPVDVIQVNDHYVMNIAALGEAAKVTRRTPELLKGVVGKLAYSLSSLVSFFDTANPVPFTDKSDEGGSYVFGYVCNGISCGGGFEVAPASKINDGEMDVLLIRQFDFTKAANVTFDLWQNNGNQLIKRYRTSELRLESETPVQMSIDGEVYSSSDLHFKCLNKALKMVIHPEAALITEESDDKDHFNTFGSLNMLAT